MFFFSVNLFTLHTLHCFFDFFLKFSLFFVTSIFLFFMIIVAINFVFSAHLILYLSSCICLQYFIALQFVNFLFLSCPHVFIRSNFPSCVIVSIFPIQKSMNPKNNFLSTCTPFLPELPLTLPAFPLLFSQLLPSYFSLAHNFPLPLILSKNSLFPQSASFPHQLISPLIWL